MRQPPPDAIGRYRILHQIGRGGLGEVYAAFDEHLARRVAIKLARPDRMSARQQQRLVHEARAMARLSSRYVVEVFDAGVRDGRVFIAMELVAGTTLGGWCKQRPRSVAEILEVFIGAGTGLLAAHEAGLIHRDFKPANVLIGGDGVPRVTDFGLAIPAEPTSGSAGSGPGRPAAGTPAYMAPEQRAGERVDARADQFAFCVALRQALRPEPDTGPSPRGRIPPGVEAAVARGLSPNPDQRFESMAGLLGALSPAPGRRRMRWGLSLVGLGGVALLGWLGGGSRPPTPCEAGLTRARAQWNESREVALREAFIATGAPAAAVASQRTAERLTRWDRQWRSSWATACAAMPDATAARPRHLDCLTQRHGRFSALVSRLMQPDVGLVGRGAAAAAELSPPVECLDPTADARVPGPPPDALAEAMALRDELAQVHADDLAGRVAQGLARAEQLVDRAAAFGYAPVLAEANFRLGRLHERAGSYEQARPALEDAYYLAARNGQVRLQADASTMLVTVLGIRLQAPRAAAPWLRHAEAAVDRLDDRRRQAAVLVASAGMRAQQGRHAQARADYDRALTLQRAVFEPGHPTLAATLNNLGTVAAAEGNFGAAQDALGQAVVALEGAYGAQHPSVAGALGNLGAVESHLGHTEVAIEYQQRALAILRGRLGDTHPTLAPLLANLGRMRLAQGDPSAARPLFARALAIRRAALGDEHPEVAYAHVHLADADRRLGALRSAEEHYRRGLEILGSGVGGIEWRAGYAHAGLGWVALARSQVEAATAYFDAAALAFGDHAPPADRAELERGRDEAQAMLASSSTTTTRVPLAKR